MSNFKLGKIDVACCQLKTAIGLYFESGDPVSVHTLSAASFNILNDLIKNKGLSYTTIRDKFLDEAILDSYKKEAARKLREAENFFKHADLDPDKDLELNPEMTEFFIFDGCFAYKEITGKTPLEFHIFKTWMMIKNESWFLLPISITAMKEDLLKGNDKLDKKLYYDTARLFLEKKEYEE